jgi:hypothetical protein
MMYGHDKPVLPGDYVRKGFSVGSMSYKYVQRLSTDHLGVFVAKRRVRNRVILAFRGTDLTDPKRILGIDARVLFTKNQMKLDPNERRFLTQKYCPASSYVGCLLEDAPTVKTSNGKPQFVSQEAFEKRVSGGVMPIDSASDCAADTSIARQEEHLSRLHRFQADALYRMLQLFAKSRFGANADVYVTGHSLGGSLAAYSVCNTVLREGRPLNVHLVMFSPGSGPGRVSTLLSKYLSQPCTGTDTVGKAKQETAAAVLQAASLLHPEPAGTFEELQRNSEFWTQNVLSCMSYREQCDGVSFSSANWWPTTSFELSGSAPSSFRCQGSEFHSVVNYMAPETYERLTGVASPRARTSGFVKIHVRGSTLTGRPTSVAYVDLSPPPPFY